MKGEPSVEQHAEKVVTYIMNNGLMGYLDFSVRSDGFRINLVISRFPGEIATSIRKCTRYMSTTIDGAKVRVRFLSSKLLDENVCAQMKLILACVNMVFKLYYLFISVFIIELNLYVKH